MTLDPAFRQIIAGFRNSGAWDDELDLHLLKALWPRVAGPSLARNTRVVGFTDHRVTVRVPDATWKQELGTIRPELLRKLNQPWPGAWIRDIRFTDEDHTR